MRFPFQGTFRDGQGNIIVDGLVSVFDANTTTPSTIYTLSVGGTSVNSVLSDSKGYFIFYIDDSDYPLYTERFDITLSKQSYTDQLYEDIVVFGQVGATGPQGIQGIAGPGVASGGTDGQVLTKTSSVDYETAWEDIPESASIIETQVFM